MKLPAPSRVRRKAVWGSKALLLALVLGLTGVTTDVAAAPRKHRHSRQGAKARPGVPGSQVKRYRLDDELSRRAEDKNPRHTTRVIVTLIPGAKLPAVFERYVQRRDLDIVNGVVLDLPNYVLKTLAAHPDAVQVHYDREIGAHNYRTAITVGARTVQEYMGLNGAGVGVAVIDSGISTFHDDLTNTSSTLYPYGNQ